MGFRSTFVTQDLGFGRKWPEWFVTRWGGLCEFGKNGQLSSVREEKTYGRLDELDTDIQKAIREMEVDEIVLVYLHECGGITRVQIDHDKILYSEPQTWKVVDGVTHDYCYGCSDVVAPKEKTVLK
jgi:hypothetical protein